MGGRVCRKDCLPAWLLLLLLVLLLLLRLLRVLLLQLLLMLLLRRRHTCGGWRCCCAIRPGALRRGRCLALLRKRRGDAAAACAREEAAAGAGHLPGPLAQRLPHPVGEVGFALQDGSASSRHSVAVRAGRRCCARATGGRLHVGLRLRRRCWHRQRSVGGCDALGCSCCAVGYGMP